MTSAYKRRILKENDMGVRVGEGPRINKQKTESSKGKVGGGQY